MNLLQMLSPQAREDIERERREALRMFALSDVWLAYELMRLTRAAQKERPDCPPSQETYDANFLWGLVPEVARRLGFSKPVSDEIDWELRATDARGLRLRVAYTLPHLSTLAGGPAWRALTRESCNGNPVVYAIDRIWPGVLGDEEDRLTRHIAEVARCRGTPYQGKWTPQVLCN